MNPIAPGVAKRLHLLRLARDVVDLAVLHIAAGRAPLEVAVELDAVGRVEVDALHLATQALALGEAGHHLQGVAEDHAVRPVLVVLVEVGLVHALGDAVEVGEEIELRGRVLCVDLGAAHEVIDQHLGVDLFLDVRAAGRGRRGRSSPARPCRARRAADRGRGCGLPFLLPARLRRAAGPRAPGLLVLLHHRLVFGGGDVLPRGLVVIERFDGLAWCFFAMVLSSVPAVLP